MELFTIHSSAHYYRICEHSVWLKFGCPWILMHSDSFQYDFSIWNKLLETPNVDAVKPNNTITPVHFNTLICNGAIYYPFVSTLLEPCIKLAMQNNPNKGCNKVFVFRLFYDTIRWRYCKLDPYPLNEQLCNSEQFI
jgi:hypothetical protein